MYSSVTLSTFEVLHSSARQNCMRETNTMEKQIDWQKLSTGESNGKQTIWTNSTGDGTSWVEEKQENLVEKFKELFKKPVD